VEIPACAGMTHGVHERSRVHGHDTCLYQFLPFSIINLIFRMGVQTFGKRGKVTMMKITSKTQIVLAMCLVFAMCLTVHTSAKSKMEIPMKGIKSIAVFPFGYVRQKYFSFESGTVVAEAFAKVLKKKGKFTVADADLVDKILKEQDIDLNKPMEKEVIIKLGELLKVDAIVYGYMPDYDEKETESYMPEGKSGYTQHVREVRLTFDIRVVHTDTGEEAGAVKTEKVLRDTARDPMRPVSPEILVSRCAKSVAKKLCKSFKK
jgi:Curli production assembly/transport component CsgG